MKMRMLEEELFPSTPGKVKMDRGAPPPTDGSSHVLSACDRATMFLVGPLPRRACHRLLLSFQSLRPTLFQYRIFNLGNTSPVTVPTLVSILEKHLKVKAKKNVIEMPGNGDVPFTHANISYARAELGYKPTTNLEAGLKKFVKWYLSYYGYARVGKNL
ncbi:UDP-glucuronate 4-epimerase 1-like [Asparagus officinalis]|uniref:UDP-glucuronate 4-epimerase 1-like n=1 Tax=Asparagus officinalis TaxID=4686 RepID=UPI00098E1403|nr:UDP-glucuronate 4-epimerase 1-like [Asparagus officinalis]